jgi:sporulation protein YlmC with PRC-barrel domain
MLFVEEGDKRMLCSANELEGFEIVATDGEIGTVGQFYFDDERWAVRYIIVDTGTWLSGRQVLISPFSVTKVDRGNKKLQVSLTRSQVEMSPLIDTHKPVSRQMEAAHSDYYGYPHYWKSPLLWGVEERPAITRQPSARAATAHESAASTATTAEMPVVSDDVHLRSAQEVGSYFIEAADGEIGHVDDLIVDDETWAIRYLIVDTGNWWPGKRVLISPQWISSIEWAQSKVHVHLSRDGVKKSPTYDSSMLVSRDYEQQLYGHYGQPGYWSN